MMERVSTQRVALYPGSFDPITLGHLDILERATEIFDRVVVSVLRNPDKQPLFSVEERVELIREATRSLDGEVEVDAFDGLTVEHASAGRSDCHRARSARGERLRERVPDGADEPPPRPRHPHRLPDDLGAQRLHVLGAGEGGLPAGGRHQRVRPAAGCRGARRRVGRAGMSSGRVRRSMGRRR